VEADTDKEAIKEALRMFYIEGPETLVHSVGSFADDIDDVALVDNPPEENFEHSTWYTQLQDGSWTEGILDYAETIAKSVNKK
jgi:hypothetical protein